MDRKSKFKELQICEDCQKAILTSGPMGFANLSYLISVGKLKIVPKNQCQRCKARKERK